MKVELIVSNVATSDVDKASAFYKTIQVSVMSEGARPRLSRIFRSK